MYTQAEILFPAECLVFAFSDRKKKNWLQGNFCLFVFLKTVECHLCYA